MGAPSIRQAGVTIIVFTLVVKIFGLIREMVVAANYGTSQIVDVYLAGITIPAMIGTVLSQTLPNAFVPIFSSGQENGGGGTRTAFVLVALSSCAAVALWFLARPVASLTSSGFLASAREETIIVLRITAASMAFATIEALLRSRLLAQKRFAYSSSAGLWPSVAMIVAITAHPEGGARTLAWGFIAGSVASAAWNLTAYVFRRGELPRLARPEMPATPMFREGLWVTAVIVLGSTGLLYTLLDRYLASFLDEGSIAALQYANLVASQPVGIYGIAIGTAVLPYLSAKVAEGTVDAARQIFDRAIRWVLVGSVPVAVLIGVLGDDIVTILFERGAFDASSRSATGVLLIPYGFWLIPSVLMPVMLRMYYATFRWRPIMVAVIGGLAVKAVLSFWWVGRYGALGLVGASAGAAILMVLVLVSALPREIIRGIWSPWIRLLAVLAILSFVGVAAGYYLPGVLSIAGGKERAVVRVVAGTAISLGLIVFLGPRLQIGEAARLREWISGRHLRRR
jgi:putative peptidoglycan lipid II flippase